MKDYKNYWNLRQPPKRKIRDFQQSGYDKMYEVEYEKLIRGLYDLLWSNLPKECITLIEHEVIKHVYGDQCHYYGFTKKYKGAERRFTLNEDGKWYESVKYQRAFEKVVIDESLEQFVLEIKNEYLKGVDENEQFTTSAIRNKRYQS